MKKVLIKIVMIMFLALVASGCGTLASGGSFSLSEMAGNTISSALGLDDMAVELQAMEFFALYAVYGFYGGFGYETGFSEGEGVRWSHTSEDEDGEKTDSQFERVFLKDLGGGRGWWRLTVSSEDETAEYEFLLNRESEFEVLRFRDPDTGEILEYIPETDETDEPDYSADVSEEEQEYEEEYAEIEEYESYEQMEYSQYSLGEERITVGAGTFTAEHMVSEYKDNSDPEDPMDIRSDWWITESVPGGVVRYSWQNNAEGGTLMSELDEILSGQTTRLESY